MSLERIHLFFTNFPLVSVPHHNANSIAIFRYNATKGHIALNQSAASMAQ